MAAELDPGQKYLKQEETGAIYIWTEALSKRKDMRPYRPGDQLRAGLGQHIPDAAQEKIELQGKTFSVSKELYDVLMDMGSVLIALQEENATLKTEREGFEAFKERLTTDNLDLAEQLARATVAPTDSENNDTGPAFTPAPEEKKHKKKAE